MKDDDGVRRCVLVDRVLFVCLLVERSRISLVGIDVDVINPIGPGVLLSAFSYCDCCVFSCDEQLKK